MRNVGENDPKLIMGQPFMEECANSLLSTDGLPAAQDSAAKEPVYSRRTPITWRPSAHYFRRHCAAEPSGVWQDGHVSMASRAYQGYSDVSPFPKLVSRTFPVSVSPRVQYENGAGSYAKNGRGDLTNSTKSDRESGGERFTQCEEVSHYNGLLLDGSGRADNVLDRDIIVRKNLITFEDPVTLYRGGPFFRRIRRSSSSVSLEKNNLGPSCSSAKNLERGRIQFCQAKVSDPEEQQEPVQPGSRSSWLETYQKGLARRRMEGFGSCFSGVERENGSRHNTIGPKDGQIKSSRRSASCGSRFSEGLPDFRRPLESEEPGDKLAERAPAPEVDDTSWSTLEIAGGTEVDDNGHQDAICCECPFGKNTVDEPRTASLMEELYELVILYARRHHDVDPSVHMFDEIFHIRGNEWFVEKKRLVDAVACWVCPNWGQLSDPEVTRMIKLILLLMLSRGLQLDALRDDFPRSYISDTTNATLFSWCVAEGGSTMLRSMLLGALSHVRCRLIVMREAADMARTECTLGLKGTREDGPSVSSCSLCVRADRHALICTLLSYLKKLVEELGDPKDTPFSSCDRMETEFSCTYCCQKYGVLGRRRERQFIVEEAEQQNIQELTTCFVDSVGLTLTESLPRDVATRLMSLIASQCHWITYCSSIGALETLTMTSRSKHRHDVLLATEKPLDLVLGLLCWIVGRGTASDNVQHPNNGWYQHFNVIAQIVLKSAEFRACFDAHFSSSSGKKLSSNLSGTTSGDILQRGCKASSVLDNYMRKIISRYPQLCFPNVMERDAELIAATTLSKLLLFLNFMHSVRTMTGLSTKSLRVQDDDAAVFFSGAGRAQRRYKAQAQEYFAELHAALAFPLVTMWLASVFLQGCIAQEDVFKEISGFPSRLFHAIAHLARWFSGICATRADTIARLTPWNLLTEKHSTVAAYVLHYFQFRLSWSRLSSRERRKLHTIFNDDTGQHCLNPLSDTLSLSFRLKKCTAGDGPASVDRTFKGISKPQQFLVQLRQDVAGVLAHYVYVSEPTADAKNSSRLLNASDLSAHEQTRTPLWKSVESSSILSQYISNGFTMPAFQRRALLVLFARVMVFVRERSSSMEGQTRMKELRLQNRPIVCESDDQLSCESVSEPQNIPTIKKSQHTNSLVATDNKGSRSGTPEESHYSVCCCFLWLWAFLVPEVPPNGVDSHSESEPWAVQWAYERRIRASFDNSTGCSAKDGTSSSVQKEFRTAVSSIESNIGDIPLEVAIHCLQFFGMVTDDEKRGQVAVKHSLNSSILHYIRSGANDGTATAMPATLILSRCPDCPLNSLYGGLQKFVNKWSSPRKPNRYTDIKEPGYQYADCGLILLSPTHCNLGCMLLPLFASLSRIHNAVTSLFLEYNSLLNLDVVQADRPGNSDNSFRPTLSATLRIHDGLICNPNGSMYRDEVINTLTSYNVEKVLGGFLAAEVDRDEVLWTEMFVPELVFFRSILLEILGMWMLACNGSRSLLDVPFSDYTVARVGKLFAVRTQCLFLDTEALQTICEQLLYTDCHGAQFNVSGNSSTESDVACCKNERLLGTAYESQHNGTFTTVLQRFELQVIIWVFQTIVRFLVAVAVIGSGDLSACAAELLSQGVLSFLPPVTSDADSIFEPFLRTTDFNGTTNQDNPGTMEPRWLREARHRVQVNAGSPSSYHVPSPKPVADRSGSIKQLGRSPGKSSKWLNDGFSVPQSPQPVVTQDTPLSHSAFHPFYYSDIYEDQSLVAAELYYQKQFVADLLLKKQWAAYPTLLILLLRGAVKSCGLDHLSVFVSRVLSRLARVASERCCMQCSCIMRTLVKAVHTQLEKSDCHLSSYDGIRGSIAAVSLCFVAVVDPLKDAPHSPVSTFVALRGAQGIEGWIRRKYKEINTWEAYMALRIAAMHQLSETIAGFIGWLTTLIRSAEKGSSAKKRFIRSLRRSRNLLASGCLEYMTDELRAVRVMRYLNALKKAPPIGSSIPETLCRKPGARTKDIEECILNYQNQIALCVSPMSAAPCSEVEETSCNERHQTAPMQRMSSEGAGDGLHLENDMTICDGYKNSLKNTGEQEDATGVGWMPTGRCYNFESFLGRLPQSSEVVPATGSLRAPLCGKTLTPRRRICPEIVTDTPVFRIGSEPLARGGLEEILFRGRDNEDAPEDSFDVLLSQEEGDNEDFEKEGSLGRTPSRDSFQDLCDSFTDASKQSHENVSESEEDLKGWIVFDDEDVGCLQNATPQRDQDSVEVALNRCRLEPHWKIFIDGMFCSGRR